MEVEHDASQPPQTSPADLDAISFADLEGVKNEKEFYEGAGISILINLSLRMNTPMESPKDIKPTLMAIGARFKESASDEKPMVGFITRLLNNPSSKLIKAIMAQQQFDKGLERVSLMCDSNPLSHTQTRCSIETSLTSPTYFYTQANICEDNEAGQLIEGLFEDGIKTIIELTGKPFEGKGSSDPDNAIGVKSILRKLCDSPTTKKVTLAWRDMHGFDPERFTNILNSKTDGAKPYPDMCDALLYSLKYALKLPENYKFQPKKKGKEAVALESGKRVDRTQLNAASGKCAVGLCFV